NGKIHSGMKTDSSFIRPDRRIHLNSETAVDMDFTFVIYPWNTENYYSFCFYHSFQELHALIVFSAFYERNHGNGDFFYSLQKLRLVRIFRFYLGDEILNFLIYVIIFHRWMLLITTNLVFFSRLPRIIFRFIEYLIILGGLFVFIHKKADKIIKNKTFLAKQ